MSMTVAPDQIDRIVWNQHHDPFEVLGPHQIQDNGKSSWVVRAYLPRASAAWVVRPEERKEYAMQPVHHPNFFECVLDVEQLSNYQLRVQEGDHERQSARHPAPSGNDRAGGPHAPRRLQVSHRGPAPPAAGGAGGVKARAMAARPDKA